MFKLPNGIPNYRTSAQDWADFAEYHALLYGKINLYELSKSSRLISDEEMIIGIEDDTDRYLQKVDEISAEIKARMAVSTEHYPFILEDHDYSLHYKKVSEIGTIIYSYLLLATRSNMSKDRRKADIDGTLLFEHLCAAVAQNYLGFRSESRVFGTSKEESGDFRSRLREITVQLNEGGDIHENPGHRPQDEKVDIIIWKGFKDLQPSQLIAFGQCKTGTSWTQRISELNTESFCKTWFTRQPVLTPIRMFFTAQYFPREIFRVRANEAGLVFDRFRILDYLPNNIDDYLLHQMEEWTNAILLFYQTAS